MLCNSGDRASVFNVCSWNRNNASIWINSYSVRSVSVNLPHAHIALGDNGDCNSLRRASVAFRRIRNNNLIYARIRKIWCYCGASVCRRVYAWNGNISANRYFNSVSSLCKITFAVCRSKVYNRARRLLVDSNSEVAIFICFTGSDLLSIFVGNSNSCAWNIGFASNLLTSMASALISTAFATAAAWLVCYRLSGNLRSLKASCFLRFIRRVVILILSNSSNRAAVLQVFCWNRNFASFVVNLYAARSRAVNLPLVVGITFLNNNRANWLLWAVKRIWLSSNHNRNNCCAVIFCRRYCYVSVS